MIHYLLRAYDKTNALGPRASTPSSEPTQQDHVDFNKWEFFLVSTLASMQGQLTYFRHLHPTKNDDALARYEEQTYGAYDVLEGQLGESGGAGVLPGGFGAVDAHFYPWVKEGGYAGLEMGRYPGIKRWLEVVGEVPAVREAYQSVAKGERVGGGG